MTDLYELIRHFPAASEYLSEIFFQHRENGVVTNRRLAERLHVSPPAVTQAMRRLTRLGLVAQNTGGTIALTDDGRHLAERIIRRHFILERVLVDILGYPWDRSDGEADALHPGLSEELEAFLFDALGRPTTCPHGNPIPGNPDTAEILAAPRLPDLETGESFSVVRITEEGEHVPGLLPCFEVLGIRPEMRYRLASADDEGAILEPKDGGPGAAVTVPSRFATFIAVRREGGG